FSEWNRAYGSNGFLQYQFNVPRSEVDAFKEILRDIQRSGHYSFLNVFKLFGPGNQAPLSFPMEGWNITVDFPINDRLNEFVNYLDGRSWRSAAASTPPRTRGSRPIASTRCTRRSTRGSPPGAGSTRTASSSRTWAAGSSSSDPLTPARRRTRARTLRESSRVESFRAAFPQAGSARQLTQRLNTRPMLEGGSSRRTTHRRGGVTARR